MIEKEHKNNKSNNSNSESQYYITQKVEKEMSREISLNKDSRLYIPNKSMEYREIFPVDVRKLLRKAITNGDGKVICDRFHIKCICHTICRFKLSHKSTDALLTPLSKGTLKNDWVEKMKRGNHKSMSNSEKIIEYLHKTYIKRSKERLFDTADDPNSTKTEKVPMEIIIIEFFLTFKIWDSTINQKMLMANHDLDSAYQRLHWHTRCVLLDIIVKSNNAYLFTELYFCISSSPMDD